MSEPRKMGNLVRLMDIDTDFIIDLRYATEDNFTKSAVYLSAECYIDCDTALRLIEARNIFKRDGYRVKIWDAYRPVSAQRRLWDIFPDNNFVAYPPDMYPVAEFKNSHMNGQCVDITLTDSEGREIPMPSEFDDFTERASLKCVQTTGEPRRNAEYMRDVMVRCGFTPHKNEWWHFYNHLVEPAEYSDWEL